MKKAVLKVEVHDGRLKKKAMATVSGLLGVHSVEIDMKTGKMTVVGDIDTVIVVKKLRKICHTEIMTVEPVKKPAPQTEKNKKPDPSNKDQGVVFSNVPPDYYNYYYYYYYPWHANSRCIDENPNSCGIL